jgi:type I restriction enzyme S subunit
MIEAWQTKPFSQIVTLQRGFDLPAQSRGDGEIAVVGSNGIVGFHNSLPTNVPVPGLMVGRSGSVGEITFWNKEYWPLNTVLYVKDFHGNDPCFLSFWLRLFPFKQYAEGVSVPTLNRNSISDVPFPLPKFDDQKKISAALTAVEMGIKLQRAALSKARELKRVAMRELFTRGLKSEPQKETEIGFVPESWLPTFVSSLGQVVTGTTPPTKDTSSYLGGEIPFIAPGDFEHGTKIIRTMKKVTSRGLALSRALQKGTTCFVCIGSTIGKVGLIVDEVSSTNQQINSIVPFDDFDPHYIFHLMTFWSEYIRKQASQSPVPILSKGVFEKIELFASRDRAEQIGIVEILDALDRKIDLHKRKRGVLDDLLKTLLHKLMIGEILVADLDLSALSEASLEGVAA